MRDLSGRFRSPATPAPAPAGEPPVRPARKLGAGGGLLESGHQFVKVRAGRSIGYAFRMHDRGMRSAPRPLETNLSQFYYDQDCDIVGS